MLAVSQGLPIKCFAVGVQKHPYCFFSLKKKPIRSAQDMVGKKVGIQATGMILLRALLQEQDRREGRHHRRIGADMTPLMTGQVDAVTGWLTNTTALKVLGAERVDMALWDTGVKLYALPYYATTRNAADEARDVLAGFLRAAGQGLAWADKNRDEAVDILVKEYPNLDRADERGAADVMLTYSFDAQRRARAGGRWTPRSGRSRSRCTASSASSRPAPKVEEVITLDILKATRRPPKA